MGAWPFELAGKRAGVFILARGSFTHPCTSRRLDLCAAFLTFSQQEVYLGVFLHSVPSPS